VNKVTLTRRILGISALVILFFPTISSLASEYGINQVIHFEVGSSFIQNVSKPLLLDVVNLLKNPVHKYWDKILIEGYSDGVENKDKSTNLSLERAEAVKNYLIQQGVDSSLLEVVGWGSQRPIANDETEQGRAKNRRVEFLLVTKSDLKNYVHP